MSLLKMSFTGAVIILIILALRGLFINKLPKKAFLVLWAVAVIRLLIPFSIPFLLSIYTLAGKNTKVMEAVKTSGASGFLPFSNTSILIPDIQPQKPAQTIPILPLVWLIGALALAGYFTISYMRCRREFRTALPVENDFTKNWLKEHKLKRTIVLRQSQCITAPLTYGIVHPVILMPKAVDWSDTGKLQYVLAHEYVHIRRFDAGTKLILLGAVCVHWFNPLVWLMYLYANRDIELSCDEAVVRFFGENTKSAYAMTLITMEETKSGIAPLCNSFSKNAIKERIISIMKIKKTSLIAILAAFILITGITALFTTTAVSGASPLAPIPNTPFTDEEYEKLIALQFKGYEAMTIAQYQEKVWVMTDTREYRELLERFEQNEQLYEMKDINETAAFLCYIYNPLTAENWSKREFGGYISTNYEAADNASLEYWFELTILDRDTLTVGEYNRARLGMSKDLEAFLLNESKERLADETVINELIQKELPALIEKWGSKQLTIYCQYSYQPLTEYEQDYEQEAENANEEEPRTFRPGTAEDYESLFTLKTKDYQNMTVAAFNELYLQWCNENFDRMEIIKEDAFRNDYRIPLTEEEKYFAAFTATRLSGEENYRRIRSLEEGKPEEDPVQRERFSPRQIEENGLGAWCQLDYIFTYHIKDKEALTIGERDRCIGEFVNEVRKFWEETDIEELLVMTKTNLTDYIEELASKYSNNQITIKIDKNNTFYESMDERAPHL